MRAHQIALLEFEHLEEYEIWCSAHGFSLSLQKSEAQRLKEVEARQQERATDALTAAHQRHDSPDALIARL